MGIRKVFVSRTGEELAAIATSNGELSLEITEGDEALSIFLDYEDTVQLIRELTQIKKQIAK